MAVVLSSVSRSYCAIAGIMTNPVPPEQQPLNEFTALSESYFFAWGKAEGWRFWRVVLCIWLGWSVVAIPLAMASFDPHKQLGKFLSATGAGASIGLAFILLRLFLGWSYVYHRLNSDTILYEETGWYDGQIWQKSEVELAQHRLIANYQVLPILRRIRAVGLVVTVVLGVSLAGAIF
ncbi:MAG: CGLD27 family protein [Pseudanabaenaceae cyanobacterium SKYGB_i_bin29]|nr:CGLD27 family protein [Pseudanabaenaceae cyanobacterium SKYG29]MDW8421350.1 CGLD27 family protein [Pseudanabaenaceae cyanobacterium SKYGB_i_bin29]